MNVRLHHGRVDPQLRAVLQTEIDRGLNHRVIHGLQRRRGEPIERSVERIVLRHASTLELRELP